MVRVNMPTPEQHALTLGINENENDDFRTAVLEFLDDFTNGNKQVTSRLES